MRKDPPRLQTWTNTVLAETWADQGGEVVPPDPLMARREAWGDSLPAAVRLLTAGVDVQADRIELTVAGWGSDEEAWIVEHRQLWGDPTGPRVWEDLDRALAQTFPHANGVRLPIRAACVDTGGMNTKAAYEYCRSRFARRVWGIKGRGGPGVPVWPVRPSKSKAKTPIFIIGVDAIKDSLFARLKLAEPGPGFVHFARSLDAEYFRQLTSENRCHAAREGPAGPAWTLKRGARNEALDCVVFSTAALHGLIAGGLRLNDEQPAGAVPTRPTVVRSAWMGR